MEHALTLLYSVIFATAIVSFTLWICLIVRDRKLAKRANPSSPVPSVDDTLKADAQKVEQETATALKVAEADTTTAAAVVRSDVSAAVADVKKSI